MTPASDTGSDPNGPFTLRHTVIEHVPGPPSGQRTETTQDGFSGTEIVDFLDARESDARTTPGLRHSVRTWARLQLFFEDDVHVYDAQFTESDPLKLHAGAALACASSHKSWPHAAFTIRSTIKRWFVDWIDGPTVAQVRAFHDRGGTDSYIPRPKHLVLHRHHSTAAWAHIATMLETTLAVAVPRIADGSPDWPAALHIPITVPADESLPQHASIHVAGRLRRRAATLAEALRTAAETTDFTHEFCTAEAPR